MYDRRDQDVVLLTNNHVLTQSSDPTQLPATDAIFQPARRSAHRPKQARRSDRAGAPGIGGLSLVRSPDNLEISRRAAMAAPHSVHRERVNSSSSQVFGHNAESINASSDNE